MQNTSIEPPQVVHLELTNAQNLRTERQIFNMSGAHILPFNNKQRRDRCLSAVVRDADQYESLRLNVELINEQSPIPHQDILRLIV